MIVPTRDKIHYSASGYKAIVDMARIFHFYVIYRSDDFEISIQKSI